MTIDKTAVVDKDATLDPSVYVGPYAVVGAGVVIGEGTKVQAHSVISGATTIGKNNVIGSFSAVGGEPQDLSYNNEPTELIIGDNNLIREYVSIHRGTAGGRGKTVIGDNNLLMAYSHVAHDCVVGNNVVMANVATLAGHVEVGDFASISGLVAVHQFCRIGTFSFVGGVSGISKDVPPYIIVAGTRNSMRVSGINKVGLRRNNFTRETIARIDAVFRIIYRHPDLLLKDAVAKIKEEVERCEEVDRMVKFIEESRRGVVRGSDS